MSSGGSNELDQIERDELLQRFVPVQVFSNRSVRMMKEQEISLIQVGERRVAVIHVCSQKERKKEERKKFSSFSFYKLKLIPLS